MKKIYIIIVILLLGIYSTTVSAAEKNQEISVENSNEQEIIWGEIKNGMFVRTFDEEVALIPYKQGTQEYTDEYFKIIEARKLDALTPEMEAAGYVLVNGNVYETVEGEMSEAEYKKQQTEKLDSGEETEYDADGNPVDTKKLGFVTFTAQVEDTIKETCFVAVTGIDIDRYYEFDLNEINGYSTTVQMPAGTYIISDGGISNDFTSKYPLSADNKEFEVKEGTSIIVPFNIGDVNNKEIEPEEKKTQETIALVENPQENAAENNNINKNFVVGFIITLILLALLVFGIYQWFSNKRKDF